MTTKAAETTSWIIIIACSVMMGCLGYIHLNNIHKTSIIPLLFPIITLGFYLIKKKSKALGEGSRAFLIVRLAVFDIFFTIGKIFYDVIDLMNFGIKHIIELIFPKTCINCKKTGDYLCTECKKFLQPHPEICPYCHKFSANYQTCLECKINHHNALEGIIVPFSYNHLVKRLILQLKYYHHKDVANFLADRLVLALQINEKLKKIFSENKDSKQTTIITYIPSHRYRKHFIKGYNQSEILATLLSEKTEIPMIPLLQKPQASKSQVQLQRTQRFINIQGKFIKNPETQLQGNETIIIVDDLTTTSATINEAALTIKQHYPFTKIRGLVIARHN